MAKSSSRGFKLTTVVFAVAVLTLLTVLSDNSSVEELKIVT